VRAAALALVTQPQRFQRELLGAVADRDLRVREAGARALSTAEAGFATPALRERLREDEWPLVRAAAADALARHPKNEQVDEALTKAVGDDSPLVRARSIRALSDRNARGATDRIRDRLADAEEWPEVRAEAARALGALCDAESVGELTAFTKPLADPMASPPAQLIGTAAVTALGRIAPRNLQQLLAPLTAPKAPPQAQRAAARALTTTDKCR
jgi:HEAT repeats